MLVFCKWMMVLPRWYYRILIIMQIVLCYYFYFIGSLTVLVKLKTIFNLLAANRLSSHLKMGFNCNCARQRARLFCCVLLVNPIKDLILTPNLLEIRFRTVTYQLKRNGDFQKKYFKLLNARKAHIAPYIQLKVCE